MTEWVEYPAAPGDNVGIGTELRPRKARRLISPGSEGALFVYGEWDEDLGIWIVTGVSEYLSTGLVQWCTSKR
jgi:hypothetical protein